MPQRKRCLPGCTCRKHAFSGNPNGNPRPLVIRLRQRMKITPDGCYEWVGATGRTGYPYIKFRGKRWGVHRLIAHLLLGYQPRKGKVVAHICNNKRCFRPSHLRVWTQTQNMEHAVKCGRTTGALGVYVPLDFLVERGISREEIQQWKENRIKARSRTRYEQVSHG